jgi:hypothetical protein
MVKSTGATTVLLTGTAYTVCSVTPDGVFVIISQSTSKTAWSYSLFDGSRSRWPAMRLSAACL